MVGWCEKCGHLMTHELCSHEVKISSSTESLGMKQLNSPQVIAFHTLDAFWVSAKKCTSSKIPWSIVIYPHKNWISWNYIYPSFWEFSAQRLQACNLKPMVYGFMTICQYVSPLNKVEYVGLISCDIPICGGCAPKQLWLFHMDIRYIIDI